MFKIFVLSAFFTLHMVGCASSVEKKVDSAEDGFKLVAVKKGSIYDRLGLQKGDVLTRYNDKAISSPQDAMGLYEALKSKDKVKIFLKRDGKDVVVQSPKPPLKNN